MSFPFHGQTLTFTQPDGATFDVVGRGDQHRAVFETTSGYTVVPDTEGVYRYAQLAPSGELIPTSTRADASPPAGLTPGLRAQPRATRGFRDQTQGFLQGGRRCEQRWEERKDRLTRDGRRAPPGRGTVGSYRGLCILVQFPDVHGTIARQEVDDFCNLPGYRGFGNNGSVYEYFLDVSGGRFQYRNSVVGYYTAKHPRSYYTDEKIPDGTRARELITEALLDLKTQGFDFKSLSADGEGYVYAVNVFYAGKRVNNWPKGLWPHSWSLARPLELAPGRRAFDYQITDMGAELTLATFCHENGHMVCDFPDLYDYGYESNGIGNYSLMCAAGDDPKDPVRVDAYLRLKAGWIGKVTTAADGMTAELPADGSEVLLFPKSAIEYYLIENRFRQGRDATLPASGLAVWHVDERGSNNNEQMTAARHYECALVQADGKLDLERGKNQGDAGDLFSNTTQSVFSDASTPAARWWDGTASGLRLRDISAPGERMSLRVGDAPATAAPLTGETTPDLAIPDNTFEGVASTLTLAAAPGDRVGAVEVDVQIRHTYRADLKVSLVSPAGTTVMLHDRSGGGAKDLRARFTPGTTPALDSLSGEPCAGPWTLKVQDVAPADTGALERWGLAVTRAAAAPAVLAEEPGVAIPDNDPAGIARPLACSSDGTAGAVEVSVEITHTYIADLSVSLVSPRGTTVVLHDRAGGSADNLIRTFTATSVPALADLAGEPTRGTWTLRVADLAGQDTGKLVRWSLRLG